MMSTAADTQFHHLYAGVKRRQRLVKLLRWTIPLVGALIFAALMVPLLLNNLLPSTQFEGIRLEQDRLVVDEPRARGVLSDGGSYEITAQSATTKLINQDAIDLTNLQATISFVDGATIVGTSATGIFSLRRNILTMNNQIDLSSSTGDTGRIGNGVADLNTKTFDGDDGVAFDFSNGSTLRAQNMHYDSAAEYWRFERASLTFPPQEEPAANE